MKKCFCTITILLLALTLTLPTQATAGHLLVIEIVPTMIEFSKTKTTSKGTSGGGAAVGAVFGGATGWLYAANLPVALIGTGIGILAGNKLEKDIMDKKTTSESQKATVPGYYVKLSNGKYYLTTTRYQLGQRISLESIDPSM